MKTDTSLTVQLSGAAFFSGFATMGFEMLLGRALVPYFGGTIYTWGALIGMFLLGMSLGFAGGGRLSVRKASNGWLFVLLAVGGALIAITPLLLETTCLALLDQFDDVRIPAVLASTAFAFLPAAAFAAISPMCVRLALRDIHLAGAVAGRLSALNTFGSIVGTLATSFLLVPHFGTRVIFLMLGAASVVVGLLVGYKPISLGAQVARKHGASLSLLVAALAAATLGFSAPDARAAGPGVAPGESVLESVESEYNNIFVIQNGNLIYLNFGYRGSQYIESVLDRTRPNDLAVEYTRYMSLGLIYPDKLERAALVGLGGGRTGEYLVRTVPGLKLDIAELDPDVIRLAQKYFGVAPTDRLKIHPQDGRLYLNKVKDTYDLVLVDAYRGPFVPYHLLTKEFFTLIKSRLSPTGVVVQNIEPTTMLLDSAIVTIRSVFPNVDVYNANGNIVVVGSSGPPKSSDAMRAKAQAFDDKYHPLYSMQTLLGAKRGIMVAPDAKLLTDDFAPVEMLHTVKRHNEKLPTP